MSFLEEIKTKQFQTVRLREGYDVDEVDSFLERVESEYTAALREIEQLELRSRASAKTAVLEAPWESVQETAPPVSESAARILEMAQTTADAAITEANESAEKLRAEASTLAEQMKNEARVESEIIRRDAKEALEREQSQIRLTHKAKLDSLQDQMRELEERMKELGNVEANFKDWANRSISLLQNAIGGKGE